MTAFSSRYVTNNHQTSVRLSSDTHQTLIRTSEPTLIITFTLVPRSSLLLTPHSPLLTPHFSPLTPHSTPYATSCPLWTTLSSFSLMSPLLTDCAGRECEALSGAGHGREGRPVLPAECGAPVRPPARPRRDRAVDCRLPAVGCGLPAVGCVGHRLHAIGCGLWAVGLLGCCCRK
jgi:hypothetical protein